jgi:outer membrane protein OmpA-like peptidoglycan-associated protein
MISSRTMSAGRRLMTGLPALIAVILVSASALAQSDSNPKWDVFAGYQYLNPGGTVPTGADPNNPIPFKFPGMSRGLGGAVTYNLDSHWGAEGDLGYNWDPRSGTSEWTAGAGPRFIVRTEGLALFLHALGTLNRVSYESGLVTHNGIGIILGGGMDIPLGRMFSWRVFGVDYVWAQHNFANLAAPEFSSLRRPEFEGVRLRTGVVINWGGAEELVPAASCTVQPAEVMVGEPISATATASNFNPKHPVTYSWSGNGGPVSGKDTTASIDTANAAPGSYTITAHVTDPKSKKNNEASCSANYTVKPLPPKNPPTMSLSASPTELVTGGSVNLSANCTSPDGVPVSVANWISGAGTVSGTGSSATLSTAGVPAGPVTVTATCTDSRGLTGQASTEVSLENPPPPPVDKALEARLALHSVYFQTAQPSPKDPNAGLLPSQQRILVVLATDFKKYLEVKPETHINLEGHADIRGSDAYNQALTERRVARVKNFLVEQGVPAANIDTKAFGKQQNLTLEEVKSSIESRSDLTTEERKRALAKIAVIKLASNRRVDVTLSSTTGQTETSVKQFPFNAADAMSLIGGREGEKKTTKPAAKKTGKKPVKKQP